MSRPKIAVLGTGLMGGPMAANLLGAGFQVTVWNRSAEKTAPLAAKGAGLAGNPARAVADADAVIVMLSSGPVCEDVLFGSGAAANAMRKGALLIVMSSIGMGEAEAMAERAQALGLRWLDAPVSGGTPAATNGSLSIMVGGQTVDVRAASPILSAMGRVVHIGPAGTGALTKLINQSLVASTLVAVSEALLMAERGGADLAKVREALLGGFAASKILDLHGQRIIAGNFQPGGPAKYQVKDTEAALDVADDLGLDLPALKLADALFSSLVEHGGADLDHSALFLELKRRNGDDLSESALKT
ncbi:MAG: 2-hydroxy-3-oxopropionate reductase [Martelella sp.]|uniref:NAD(P)-dependent oxidoreductase n=1 Tax=unclassified Martelella TaxID=2629616 RepID=UPI000C5018B0|nr:NAD(P)-dependent oxidoreductase [Martelella sp.]MAU21902.1 2-hydroxy-3-oxopropionate reductase [Martelella sp.]|tara:strand:- start:248 stop:1153 length:906 start_codon:yes stop_codon:yes gene_type:complete